MTCTTYKISTLILASLVVILLSVVVVSHISQPPQSRIPQIYIDRTLRPDAYIHSFFNQPDYSNPNSVRTVLLLKNRVAQHGVVTVEYYSVNGGFIEVKEYYIKPNESKSFEEVWTVPDDYKHIQCKILKQEGYYSDLEEFN